MKSIIADRYVIFGAANNGIICHAPFKILKEIDKVLQNCPNYITSELKNNKVFANSKGIFYFDIHRVDIDFFFDAGAYQILHKHWMQTTQTV
jgi:hypothetical protein